MKLTGKMLLIAACFALAIPLMFTANAGAKYRSDGAVQNVTTGAWEVADPGQCYVKDSATTGHIDATGIDANSCRAIISAVVVQADCIQADAVHPTYKGRWSGGLCTGNTVYENVYPGNPAGENSALGDREGCLHCHDGMGVTHSAYKEVYMKTGHKNMLRKVTVGTPHLGPDDVAYDNAGAGTSIDWLAGGITTSTGTWPLKWIYGDWLSPTPSAMYLDGTKNMSYSCSKCHATGTSVDNAINVNKEPVVSGQLNVGDIGTGAGQIKLDLSLAGYTGDHYASWDQYGIMCSRCHSSARATEVAGNNTQPLCEGAGYVWVVPSHGTPYCTNYDTERLKWNPDYNTNPVGKNIALLSSHHGGPSDGPTVVRMCGECHRQEVNGQPYTFVGDINGTTWNKGFGDQAQTVIGGLSHGTPSPAVGHNYMNVFLNSPHARFTGTYGDITNLANYDSNFMAAAGLNEPGCIGCHNVHESLVVDGHEPFENECTDCHSAAVPDGFTPQVNIATIKHRGGAGTPLEYVAENPNHACETCHMTGNAYHFMRINTDPSYVTNYNYSVTGPDNAADDRGYADAVWLDLDIACGQCHGGGSNSTDNPPKAGISYLPKSVLAIVAEGMHNPDLAPVAGATCVWTANTWTMDVTNTSTDDGHDADMLPGDGDALLQIGVDWGDGSVSYGSAATAFNHVYSTTGTFTVSLTATDNNLQTSTTTCTTQATPAYFSISGTVKKSIAQDSENLNHATVQLLNSANVVIKSVLTRPSGTFSFGSLKPGTYKIKAVKRGFTFPAATTIVVGPSSAGNVIQALNPPYNKK